MQTRDALLSCLPPQAYDISAPGVVAEAAAAGGVIDQAANSADDLLHEHDPGRAILSLTDWERNHGLPDGCGGVADTAAARRANLLERIAARGDLSRGYYISLAERLGYPGCTITELRPMTCTDPCDSPVNGPEFVGVWRLNVPVSTAVVYMTCESPCDSQLVSWGNAQLECVISKRKPAGTRVLFGYAP